MRGPAQLLALIWIGMASAVPAADAVQLTYPPGGGYSQPGYQPGYQPGATTTYQNPGAFQNPAVVQNPGAVQNPALYQNPAVGTYGTVVPQPLPPAGAPAVGWDPYGNSATSCPPAVPIAPAAPIIPVPPTDHWHLFGEFLYLQLNDAATVSYALPFDGVFPPMPPPVPTGPVATVDPDFDIGFRAGGGYAWTAATELTGMYTWYQSDTTSSIGPAAAPLLALVVHPSTASAATVYTSASAASNLTLQMGDVDYRRTLGDDWLRTSYAIGGRFVDMEQSFSALFTGVIAPTMQDVTTNIDFVGGGIRLGMANDLISQSSGFFSYANGFASFIAGEFSSSFLQTDAAAMPTIVAATARDDSRIVPILDIELGLGWETDDRSWRFSAGYLFSAWFNVVTTEEFIRAVHTNQYAGLSDTLTFDGLVGRVDWRF